MLARALGSPAVCGTIASLLAGNLIYPNDTVRRRLQTEAGRSETYLQATRALILEGGVARRTRAAGGGNQVQQPHGRDRAHLV